MISARTGKPVAIDDIAFPVSIHGAPGSGASLFSVALFANLLLSGKKIVFFSSFEIAKDELRKFLDGTGRETEICRLEDGAEIEGGSPCHGLVVGSGNPSSLMEALARLPDIDDRIVLVKNAEVTLTRELFTALKRHGKYIVSGDLDESEFRDELLSAAFPTRIFFSRPTHEVGVAVPDTAKYVGWAVGSIEGEIRLSL